MSENNENLKGPFYLFIHEHIYPTVYEGSSFKINAFVLGEKGRGRKRVIIPCYKDPKNYDIVFVKPTISGKSYRIIKANQPHQQPIGFCALLSGAGTYTRGTVGDVFPLSRFEKQTEKLLTAYGAWGIAGRIGTYYEHLYLIYKPYPVVFRVKPAGGAHKIPRYYLVFQEKRVDKVYDEETDIYVEEQGFQENIFE
ncbi:MAG: hypothetical protein Q6363_007915 [Candidatus Njordarchaeota archaeon]